MGVITIEVPQKVRRTYRISSKISGKAVVSGVESLVKSAQDAEVKKVEKKVSLEGLVGLWADRTETAEEIARKLRSRNNRVRNG